MCGIFGLVSRRDQIDRGKFERRLDVQRHRGPDDSGVWVSPDGRVALGSCRLAIQDLSPAGHMPMSDASGKVWIVFNGEIYNFVLLRKELETLGAKFNGGSDTEVLLAAYLHWGERCLERLNGMFAFAIVDRRETGQGGPIIFLARDSLGEKPLYFRIDDQGFQFASELKVILADQSVPRRLDPECLNYFLAYGYSMPERSMVKGIEKLGAGCAMLYDLNVHALRSWRYWTAPAIDSSARGSVDELSKHFEELLFQSVRERLVADVPVGIFLSGGVDSSLIAAAAAHVSAKPVKTFTITFPGQGIYDEREHARCVARAFDTEHYELAAEPANFEVVTDLAAQCDEPLADSGMLPTYLVSKLTRGHVTVALSGDGGDELFGGYDHYRRGLRAASLMHRVPSHAREFAARLVERTAPTGFRGRNLLSMLRGDEADYAARMTTVFDRQSRHELLGSGMRNALKLEQPEHAIAAQARGWHSNFVDTMTHLDLTHYLCDDILLKSDRTSMAVSLEVRAPFLDRRIVDFAFSQVPGNYKVSKTELKILSRHLAKKLLPAALDVDRKQGFSTPIASWLESQWAMCAQILRGADPSLFNPSAIRRLLAGQRLGMRNGTRIFGLVVFEIWRRHYGIMAP